MPRAVLVANRAAGGEVMSTAQRAMELVRDHGWDAVLSWTEARGHAALLAQEAAGDGAEVVLAVGGDGTVREVAAGVAGSVSCLGIVPAGTGNSSYRELFADVPWEELLGARLVDRGSRQVDLARIEPTGEVSLLGFSVGFFAQVVRLARESSEEAGRARYALAAQRAAAAPASFEATVELDGKPFASGPQALLAIGGARRRGGVFPVLPHSRIDDGLLDVLSVRAGSADEFGALLELVLQAAHLDSPLVKFDRGARIEISSGMPLPAEVDGDLWDRDLAACTVVVDAGVLTVLGPLGDPEQAG
jgi:diacylglycerol kinase (ATP)